MALPRVQYKIESHPKPRLSIDNRNFNVRDILQHKSFRFESGTGGANVLVNHGAMPVPHLPFSLEHALYDKS